MKVTVSGADLSRAASWAQRMTPRAAASPHLSGLLLHADGEALRLSGFDYDVCGRTCIPAAVGEPGTVLLSARLLAEVAKAAAKAAVVEVAADQSWATVAAGRSEWSLPVMDASLYPELPHVDGASGTVNGETFAYTLARILPCAQREVKEPLFGGVHLSSVGDELTVATSDRYRLPVATIPWCPATDEAIDVPVSYPVLEAAVAALKDVGGDVTMSVSDRRFGLSSARHSMVCSILDRFPEWRKLLPNPDTMAGPVVTVRTADFQAAVNQILIMTESDHRAHVALHDGELVFTSGEEAGKARACCAADSDWAEPWTFTVSAVYLRDLATSVDSPQFRIHFGETGKKPLLALPLTDDGDVVGGFQHLLMPLQAPKGETAP